MRYTPSVWIDAGPVATTPGKKCSALILAETVCDLDSDGLAVYDLVHLWAGLDRMFLLELFDYGLMCSVCQAFFAADVV